MTTLADNVAYGHGLGWSFTPLNGKRPKLKAWTNQLRETPEQAAQWAAQGNVGLRTGQISGVVVIDIDEGGDHAVLNLPGTVSVYTGGDGLHMYYRCRKPVGNSAGKLGPHIDVRGDGGQVVYPGSVHPDTGKPYAWVEGYEPWTVEIAELPDHIYDRLVAKDEPKRETPRPTISDRYVAAAVAKELSTLIDTPEGGRNHQLNKAAFSLGTFVGAGKLQRTDAESHLLSAATAAGLTQNEATATIKSGLDSGISHPREAPAPRQTPQARPAGADYILTPGFHIDDGGAVHEVGTHDTAGEVLETLPKDDIYRRSVIPGQIHGEAGARRWTPLTNDGLRCRIDGAMRLGKWVKAHKKDGGDFNTILYQSCGRDVAGLVLDAARTSDAIRELSLMVSYPFYGPGWTLSAPGYSDGLYYDEPEALSKIPIETDPAAIHDILHDLVVDFPFRSDADRQNFFGLLLTPIIAPAIADNRPLHLIGASIERTGKTKLAETVLGGVVLGRPTAALQITEREDEREKRILAMLLNGETIMHLDNLPPYIDSASFASLLTSKTFQGRVLGRSEMVTLPNHLTIVASGNNIHATGELVKRTVPIILQPTTPHPERRRDFQHADLAGYVRARRRDVLGALLGLVENWLKAGRPHGAKRMGGFEGWAASVGGILAVNGFHAWLTNQDQWQEANDPRGAEMLAFVEHWWGVWGGIEVDAGELRKLAFDGGFFDWISEGRSAVTKFGRLMASHSDRPVGRWIVRKMGPRNHSRYRLEESK